MRRFVIVLISIALGAGILWMGLILAYPKYVVRYKLTIEVDVNGQTRTGANVIEVQVQKEPRFGMAGPVSLEALGDAIYLDLGAKGHVIATLGFGPKGSDIDRLYGVFFEKFGLTYEDDDLKRLATVSGRHELTGDDIPTFVTFADLSDPKTGRILRPEDVPKVFGNGVRFRRAYIETTHEPISRGIEARLRWLPHPRYFNAEACDPTAPHCLHGGHFSR